MIDLLWIRHQSPTHSNARAATRFSFKLSSSRLLQPHLAPYSLLPTPCCLLPAPSSRLPVICSPVTVDSTTSCVWPCREPPHRRSSKSYRHLVNWIFWQADVVQGRGALPLTYPTLHRTLPCLRPQTSSQSSTPAQRTNSQHRSRLVYKAQHLERSWLS